MIEKLRSHLKSDKGFTLIELLVVIAIIAILVVIVVAAINPLERLRDASDRGAAGNIRSAGTLVSTCITQEVAENSPIADIYTTTDADDGCGNAANLGSYGTVPAGVTFTANAAINNICATAANAGGHFTPVTFNSSTGATSDPRTAAGACL